MSSCAGYHTPIEDEVVGEGVSDLPSDLGSNSRGGSFLNAQVVVTISSSLSLFLSVYFVFLSENILNRLQHKKKRNSCRLHHQVLLL